MKDISIRSYFRFLSSSDRRILESYDQYLKRKNAASTREMKLNHIRQFLLQLPLTPPMKLEQVDSKHVDNYILQAQQQGYAPGTINCRLSALNDCFGFLVEEEFLTQTPVKLKRHRVSVPMRLPNPMKRAEVRKLFAKLTCVRNRTIFLLALCCGLRASEVIHLKWEDIDFERHSVRVNQGKASVDRMVYLTAEVEASLRSWLSESENRRTGYVICAKNKRSHPDRPMSRFTLHVLMKQSLKLAHVNSGKYSFHSLRHTFASELLNAGISLRSLQELMGHKSLKEVLVYAQLYEATKRQEFYKAMEQIEASSERKSITVGGG